MKKPTNKKRIFVVAGTVLILSVAVIEAVLFKRASIKAVEQARLDSEYKAWIAKAGKEFDDCVAKGGEEIEGTDLIVYKCLDDRPRYRSVEEYANRKE